MTLTSGRGPLGPNPAGRFSPPIPDHVVYVEPYPRRVRGIAGERTVVDCEAALLVHRPGRPPAYAFPADAVHGVATEPEPAAPGYVQVPWDAVDAWYEEEERLPGHYPRNPYHRIDLLRTHRHLRVEVAGTVLVDTDDTLGLWETALAPKLYVRPEQVRTDLLVPSPTTTWCNYKGRASYWSAVVDGDVVADVAWSYEDPLPESVALRGLLSFEPTHATVITDLPAS